MGMGIKGFGGIIGFEIVYYACEVNVVVAMAKPN
jgi:hypothetical protein